MDHLLVAGDVAGDVAVNKCKEISLVTEKSKAN